MKQLIYGAAVLMSTIVGVGMFGLPYAGVQSGFILTAVLLLFLICVMSLVHLFYGDIVARTKGKHRLVGYAQLYLGDKWKILVSLSVIIGFYGSLLVYIIVGGGFLSIVLSFLNLPQIFYSLSFFIIGVIAIFFGFKFIGKMDFIMGFFLIIIVLIIFISSMGLINIDNFKGININKIFIPYGAIIYSLAGMSIIPEIREIFKKDLKLFKKSIILGTAIPGLMYLLFVTAIISLTGQNTSLDAISGASGILGNKIIFAGALFGFFATITSFFALGLSLKQTFICDFKINKNLSWVFVVVVPLLLLFIEVYNFVLVISVLGGLMGAIEGVAIILIHEKIKRRFWERKNYFFQSRGIKILLTIIFIIGFVCTLISVV